MTAQHTPQPDPDEVQIQVQHLGDAPVPDLDETATPGADGTDPAAGPASGVAAPVELFTPPAVARTVQAGYAMVADRRGPHWHISDAEADAIAEPLTGELNDLAQHFPGYGVAAAAMGGRRMQLAAALAIVTAPRIVTDARLAGERRREANDAHPDAPAPGQPVPGQPTPLHPDAANGHDPAAGTSWGDLLAGNPTD